MRRRPTTIKTCVAKAVVTPQARAALGTVAAFDHALARIREEYITWAGNPDIADWEVVLFGVRADETTSSPSKTWRCLPGCVCMTCAAGL